MVDEVIREADLRKHDSLGRTRRWQLIKEGRYPAPIKIGPRRKVWLASEVDAWLEAKKAERDTK